MLHKRVKGGNVVPADAKARVEITKKCALVAVDTPNAPAKTQAVKAININDALKALDVKFKVQLRRLDGSTSREVIEIKSMDDFEEPTIVQKSDVLREQKMRMAFLHDFQNELRNNPVFREELKTFLAGDKRDEFLAFLRGWISQVKKPDNEFIKLIRS